MNKLPGLLLAILFCLLASCESVTSTQHSLIDSLLNSQIGYLKSAHPVVSKRTKVNDKEELFTLAGNQMLWEKEFDLFRQITAYERPSFSRNFTVTDGLKDEQSNLLIRRFVSREPGDLREVKFFYFKSFDRLKKIEATFVKGNLLYQSSQILTMEFEALQLPVVMTSYSSRGYQKMIVGDSVGFDLQTRLMFVP